MIQVLHPSSGTIVTINFARILVLASSAN